jgi:hypothetical protein
MAGTARPKLGRDGFPLTTGAQTVDDAAQDFERESPGVPGGPAQVPMADISQIPPRVYLELAQRD